MAARRGAGVDAGACECWRLGVDPVRGTQPRHVDMNSLEHRWVFTQAVDQPVVSFERRGGDLNLFVVIGAFVDQD